jgi:hypothetical protein
MSSPTLELPVVACVTPRDVLPPLNAPRPADPADAPPSPAGFASSYFHRSEQGLIDLSADDAWAAWGDAELNPRAADLLASLPQSAASARRTIAAIESGRVSQDAVLRAQDAIVAAEPAVLAEVQADIATSRLTPAVAKRVAEKLDLAKLPTLDLWHRTVAKCGEIGDGGKGLERLEPYTQVLATRPEAAGLLLGRIGDREVQDWPEILAVGVLGRLRVREALPAMLSYLGEDAGDFLFEELLRAVPLAARPEDASTLIDRFATGDFSTRLVIADGLAKLKQPWAAGALVALLDRCDELDRGVKPDDRAAPIVANALVDLGPTDPALFDRLLEIQRANDTADISLDLGEALRDLAAFLGRPEPRVAKVRSSHREQAKALFRMLEEKAGKPKSPQLLPDPEVTWPIQRDIAKVGRNDPCPCGSGKKYKKCCG